MSPRPQPKYYRSIALIRRFAEDRTLWLARWSDAYQHLDFVSSERLERESFLESVDREVGWQLGLDRSRDYVVAKMAQINWEQIDTLPGQSQPHHVAVAFYCVELYGRAAWDQVAADPANHWLGAREIHAGHSDSGQAINPRLTYLVSKTQVIPPWQA